MACERYRDALTDWAAGASASAGLEAHLASCEACRDELQALQQALTVVDDEMGRLLAAEPSPDLASRIRSAVTSSEASRAWRFGRLWPALAAAAALLVVFAVVAGRAPSREQDLVRDAGPPGSASATSAPEPARESAVVAAPPPDDGPGERPRVRSRRAVTAEPEILVPPGELQALQRLAADLRRRIVAPDSLLLADLPTSLPEARDVLIRPLEIVPLDPEETSGAE